MTVNKPKHILWTANSVSIPKTLWKNLERDGYKVVMAEGHEARQEIEKIHPKLWVCQADQPSNGILDEIRGIRERFPLLAIVLASRQPNVEEAVEAIKHGATEYIRSDINQEKLEAVIEGALHYIPVNARPVPKKPRILKNGSRPIAIHPTMKKILALAEKIAGSRSTVLITGESGTGKEVIARYIHHQSNRSEGPFIAINCAALPENLLESELFGHEKGAFTGAIASKKGKFQLAQGGTLLLDEISEMPVSIQAKLLRVLQEREIDRVGGQITIPVDVRVIATSNRDLEHETQKGKFRLDLYYRLNVIPIKLPTLEERPEDIVPLGNFFLEKHSVLNNIAPKHLSPEAETFLKARQWTGNVRELENLIERSLLLVDSETINYEDLEMINSPRPSNKVPSLSGQSIMPLREMEKQMIYHALDNHNGNRTHAAKVLGISVRTLRNKLNEYRQDLEDDKSKAQAL
jgi:two-component system response regulator FlrC